MVSYVVLDQVDTRPSTLFWCRTTSLFSSFERGPSYSEDLDFLITLDSAKGIS